MNAPLIIAALPQPKDQELRAILSEQRGRRLITLRVFGAPTTPALLRFPEKNGLVVSASDIPALVKILAQVEAAARDLDWLEEAA